MRLIDVSPPVSERSAVFPGDTPFAVGWTMRQDRGDSCTVSRVTLSPHTGAHVDAPSHVLDPGAAASVDALDLERFVGPCRIVSTPLDAPITRDVVETLPLAGVERALFRTRAHAAPDVFPARFAYFTPEAAEYLAAQLVLIGIDTPSVDEATSTALAAHRAFFARGVAVLEGLDLTSARDGDAELIALPLRLVGLDGSPVRAVLRVP